MSVLESLRKGTDSASTRLFIGIVVMVFILWGVGTRTRNADSPTTYATVNGVAIKDSEVRYAYAVQSRAADRNLSDAEAADLQQQVVQSLVEQEALVQEAARLGITVSGEEVAREIRKIPNFKGDAGEFSDKAYEKYLKGNRLTRAKFEERVWRQLLAEKLLDYTAHAVSVSDAEVRKTYIDYSTQVDLSFVRLPVTAFLDQIVVSDADRDAFVQANADKIKARYDSSFERFYNLPKRYQLAMILLRSDIAGTDKESVRARAEQVRKEAEGGADFAQLARKWSEDLTASSGGGMGLQAASQLDPAITAAADAAGAGKLTTVTETPRGFAVFKVEKIEDARVIPLEEARNDIAVGLIREERAPAEVTAFANKLIAAWQAAGAPPRELLDSIGLPVDSTGPFPLAETEIPRLGKVPEIQAILPTATVGQVFPTQVTVKGTTVVVGLASRTDADMANYDQIAPIVRAQMLMARQREFFAQWRADVVSRAKVEMPLREEKKADATP